MRNRNMVNFCRRTVLFCICFLIQNDSTNRNIKTKLAYSTLKECVLFKKAPNIVIVMLTWVTGVNAKSWSMNCPHAITIRVRAWSVSVQSPGARKSLLLMSLVLGSLSPFLPVVLGELSPINKRNEVSESLSV